MIQIDEEAMKMKKLDEDKIEKVSGGTESLEIPRGGKIYAEEESFGIPRGGR